MDKKAFTHPSGDIQPLIGGGFAFIPNKLPPEKLDMNALISPVGAALKALGELQGAARRLSNPWLLIQPMQRLEALTTSAMEGTYTTIDELALEEAQVGGGSADAREVLNFIRALDHANRRMDEGMPVTRRILCEAHEIMLRNTGAGRGANRLPGQYKRAQNMIGGHDLVTARYVPPTPDATPELMAEFERFINERDRKEDASGALIDLALMHYQFEAIHPFADGNGRMGRMMITLLAKSWGLVDDLLLYVSPEIEARKDAYIDLMFAVSSRSEWEAWISFFMKVTQDACGRIVQTIGRLVDLKASYRQRAQQAGRSVNLQNVVDRLFLTPVVTAPKMSEHLGITYPAAQKILQQLEKAGILTRLPGTRPQAWLAREILDLTRTVSSSEQHPE